MEYLLGIDAGSTKTSSVAYSMDGRELARARGSSANFSSQGRAALLPIIETAKKCMAQLEGTCLFCMLGSSGLRGSGLASWAEAALSMALGCPCRVVDDGILAMKAQLGSKAGALAISGTGSVVYAQKGEQVVSVGGWGHLIEERGCGSSIAFDAIRGATQAYDRGGEPSQLDLVVLEYAGLDSVLLLPSFIYSSSKAAISGLAKVVESMADKGSAEALDLLQKAGWELSDMVIQALSRLVIEEPCIAVSGSIIQRCQYVALAFEARLSEHYPFYTLLDSIVEPERAVLTCFKEHIS